tara:strand:+ start:938 stop:1273 length:336 start_codon:yes stop_codon:yes gene_type:complete
LKPRKEDVSKEVMDLLKKAKNIDKRIDKIEKSQPGYSVAFETTPHEISLQSESGGQTRNAHYTTNNHLLEVADVKNKGASSSKVNLDTMPMNERGDNSGRLIEGGDGPKLD